MTINTNILGVVCLAAIAPVAFADIEPCDPDYFATIAPASFTRDVEIVGDYLYVLDENVLEQDQTGLRILDISNPAAPVLVGALTTPGQASDIAIAGDRAYIADGGMGGLLVLDISDPASPVMLGSLDTPGACRC